MPVNPPLWRPHPARAEIGKSSGVVASSLTRVAEGVHVPSLNLRPGAWRKKGRRIPSGLTGGGPILARTFVFASQCYHGGALRGSANVASGRNVQSLLLISCRRYPASVSGSGARRHKDGRNHQ